MSIRFTRVWDADSSFQAHVSEDVAYVILPVIAGPKVLGFRIYDLVTGELEEEDYERLHEAKAAVEALVSRRGT